MICDFVLVLAYIMLFNLLTPLKKIVFPTDNNNRNQLQSDIRTAKTFSPMDFVMLLPITRKQMKKILKPINGEKFLTWRGDGNVFSDS
jgi:hypothetical protein